MGLESLTRWFNEQAERVEPELRELLDRGIQPIGENARNRETPHASVHPDTHRIGVPPGRTRFDLETGQAVHQGTGVTIADDLTTVGELSQVGVQREDAQDASVARSLMVFADTGGVTLEIAGSKVPLDPCMYYTVSRTPYSQLIFDCSLPAELYIIATARSRPFARMAPVTIHQDRVGPSFTGSPDAFTDLGFQTIDSAQDGDLSDADAQKAKIHVQNTPTRTWVVENTGANDAEVRLVGNASHEGEGRFTDVAPADQPVTVAAGATEILTLTAEAWHLIKLQARNAVNGDEITLEYEYNGVGP